MKTTNRHSDNVNYNLNNSPDKIILFSLDNSSETLQE